MNALRRIMLAFYSLLFVAACGGFIALAWNQDQQLDLNPGDFRLVASVNADDGEKWIFTALLACLILFGLLTFILALSTSGRRSGGTLRLKQQDGGTVEVTADAIESLLRDELENLPEIRQADPRVRLAGGGAVESDITAVIEPSASIAHVTNLIGVTTASTLREQVGVTNVRRPNVRIEYDEMNARPVAVRQRARPPQAPVRPQDSEPWPEPPENLRAAPEPTAEPEREPWPEPPSDLRGPNRPEDTDAPELPQVNAETPPAEEPTVTTDAEREERAETRD